MKRKGLGIGFLPLILFTAGCILGTQSLLPAEAAAAVTSVTPKTWNIIGLDSNTPAFGPNRFPVGARICTDAAGVVPVTFNWDAGGTENDDSYIKLRPGSVGTPAGTPFNHSFSGAGCKDIYFEAEVTQNSAAFDKSRRYRITAGGVSTPTLRELYVERLVSQSRNGIDDVRLNGVSVPAGGGMNLIVGNTYTIELHGHTAPGGYNQFEEFINFPNTIFKIDNVSTTYSSLSIPSPYVSSPHPALYADACLWENNVRSPNYRSCYYDYKAGANVVTTYTVTIIGGGGSSQTLNTLLYDFSGSSFHYNADYSAGARIANIIDPTALTFTKNFSPSPTNVGSGSTLSFTIYNPNAGDVGGLGFTDVFPTTATGAPSNMVAASPLTISNSCGGTLVDNLGNPLAAGSAGIRLIDGTAPAGGSCVVQIKVAVTAQGTYDNQTTGNLVVDSIDTGKPAAATLTVNASIPASPPPSSCSNPIELAQWSFENHGAGTGINSGPFAASSKAIDVSTATATYGAGTGSSSGIANPAVYPTGWRPPATGNSGNAWGISTGWAATLSPSGTTAPYFEFTVDTSNYGAVGISASYNLEASGDWSQGSNWYVLSSDGSTWSPSYTTIPWDSNMKGKWINNAISGTAAVTGTGITSFRLEVDGAKTSGSPIPTAYVDSVKITGCPRVKPPVISKRFAQNPILQNGVSTLNFLITNPNAGTTLTGVRFTDIFPTTGTGAPANMTVASPLTFSNTCGGTLLNSGSGALAAGDPGIMLTGGTISGGGTCTVTVNVTAPAAGNYTNGVVPAVVQSVTSNTILTLAAPYPGNSTTALSASKYLPNLLTGTVSVTNGGLTVTGSGTLFTQQLSAGDVIYIGTSGNIAGAASAAGTSGGNTTTDTLTVTPFHPTISLLKQVGASATGPWHDYLVLTGSDVYYKFTVENPGDVDLLSVSISDPTLSAMGVNLAACSWPTLPKYNSVTCVVSKGGAPTGSEIINTATATAQFYNVNSPCTDPNCTDTDFAVYATPGLALTKSAAQTYFITTGSVLNYSYVVTNSGSAILDGPVTVTDDLTTVTCPAVSTQGDNDEYLDPGESVTCTATYSVTAADVAAKQVTNTASATTTAGEGTPAVNTSSVSHTIRLAPDLFAIKSNDVGGTAPTNIFKWIITIASSTTGGQAAVFGNGQTLLTDDLPSSGATYVVGAVTKAGTTGTINCAIAANTLTCSASGGVTIPPALQGTVSVTKDSTTVTGAGTVFTTQLTPGSVMAINGVPYAVASIANDTQLTLSSNYAGDTAGGLVIPGSLSVPVTVTASTIAPLVNPRSGGECKADPGSVIAETNEANNSCANTVTLGQPLLTVVKSTNGVINVNPGQIVTYTVQVTNSGNGIGANIVLKDDLSPFSAFGVTNYAATGKPFDFTDSNPASGLSLGIPEYSYDNGANWTSIKPPGGINAPADFNGNVTNWKIPMTGSIVPNGSFSINYQVIVK